MQRIRRDNARVHGLDSSLEPALHVRKDEAFVVETFDASSGLVTSADIVPSPENLPYLRHSPAKSNPVGGPIFVDGVHAGGRIEVDIVGIEVASSGATWNRPDISPLGDSRRWAEAGKPFSVRIEHENGQAIINNRLRWRLAPMIGTLACAPEWEVHSSTTGQGPWGGNLDVKDYCSGATIILNAYHEGALLFVGDVHGSQGDGEYYGIADETCAEVTIRARPGEGPPMPFPRVLTPSEVIALYVAKPLEAACHGAILHLMSWLVEEFGFSRREAYLTVGLNPDFQLRVYQMTAIQSLQFVVGAVLPREYVGEGRLSTSDPELARVAIEPASARLAAD